jgi:hypothetical protein
MADVIAEAREALSEPIHAALIFGSVARRIETGEAMPVSCSSARTVRRGNSWRWKSSEGILASGVARELKREKSVRHGRVCRQEDLPDRRRERACGAWRYELRADYAGSLRTRVHGDSNAGERVDHSRPSCHRVWGTDATTAGGRGGPIVEGMSCDNASTTAVTRALVTTRQISFIIEFTSRNEGVGVPFCPGASRRETAQPPYRRF